MVHYTLQGGAPITPAPRRRCNRSETFHFGEFLGLRKFPEIGKILLIDLKKLCVLFCWARTFPRGVGLKCNE